MTDEKEISGKSADDHYTTDIHGNRVLYGLTFEETQELEELRRKWWADRQSKDGRRSYSTIAERNAQRARRLDLREKHQRAWYDVIGADLARRAGATIQ